VLPFPDDLVDLFLLLGKRLQGLLVSLPGLRESFDIRRTDILCIHYHLQLFILFGDFRQVLLCVAGRFTVSATNSTRALKVTFCAERFLQLFNAGSQSIFLSGQLSVMLL